MSKSIRVLLVEDQRGDELLILRELKKAGYEVISECVATGKDMAEALDKKEWDLVISDYVLPGFSGLAALKLIREKKLDIPCIITSGRIDEATAVEAMRAGARDYIMKDNLKRLVPAIERELNELRVRKEQSKTQEALQQNEVKLGLILEQMPCILWTTDVNLNFTSLTGAGLATYNINPYDYLGKPIAAFTGPEQMNYQVTAAHKRALSGAPISFEWRVLPDREKVFYSYIEPLRNTRGEILGVVGIALDTTERKQAEEYRRKLASIVESSNDAIISQTLEGVITSWNKGAQVIYGYAEDEVLGENISLLTYSSYGNDNPLILQRVQRGETVSNYETVHLRKDQKKINVSLTVSPIKNDQGIITGASVISRDITDHKLMERRILLSNSVMSLFWQVASKKDYLERALSLIHDWCECECAGIRIMDEATNTIPYLATRGFTEEFVKSESKLSLEHDQCACTRMILNTPEPQDYSAVTPGGSFYLSQSFSFVKDLNPTELARFRGLCIREGFQTIVIIPIRHQQTTLGAIHIADKREKALSFAEVEALESVAELIGQGVYRFDIENKITASQRRLAEAQKIARLGNWVWYIRTGELNWSDEVFNIFGLLPQETSIDYKSFIDKVYPEDRERVQRLIDEALAEKKEYSAGFRIVCKNGTSRYVYVQGEVTRDSEGNPISLSGTIQDISEMKRIEEELRALSRRLVEVQENERRTIARELHDEIGQSLTALKILLAQATRMSQGDNTALLNEAKGVVSDLMQQVREMSLNLRPSMLDDLGLLPTLLWHFERFTTQTGIKINFEHEGLQQSLPPEVNTTAYRIVQEALTNIARYSEASNAKVEAIYKDDILRLLIEDDGKGFLLSKLSAYTSTGLSAMRERVNLLNGKITLNSYPGKGTQILVELPVKEAERQDKDDKDSVSG